jgi:hypothetical protein
MQYGRDQLSFLVKLNAMSAQTICQIFVVVGAFISALAAFGSHYFGRQEQAEQRKKTEAAQAAVSAQLDRIASQNDILLQNAQVTLDVWTEVEMKHVPDGVADYLLLLFVADKGRITGKVRIKGSADVSFFSTTSNSNVPLAVPNLWVPKLQSYKVPTILEFAVTQKTEPDAALSIFTQGWIDTRGREAH